jgi:heme-binding NEAT domain protein
MLGNFKRNYLGNVIFNSPYVEYVFRIFKIEYILMNDEKATMTCEWNCKTNRFVIECKGTNNNSLYLDYMEKPEWLEYSEFI